MGVRLIARIAASADAAMIDGHAIGPVGTADVHDAASADAAMIDGHIVFQQLDVVPDAAASADAAMIDGHTCTVTLRINGSSPHRPTRL